MPHPFSISPPNNPIISQSNPRYTVNDDLPADTRYNITPNVKDPYLTAFMFDMDSFYFKDRYEPWELSSPLFFLFLVGCLGYMIVKNLIKHRVIDSNHRSVTYIIIYKMGGNY